MVYFFRRMYREESSQMTGKKDWLYQTRALAIMAVVVFHQIGILHESQWVQSTCIFHVTALVFLMGITSSFWLKSKNRFKGKEIFLETLHKMLPLIGSYIVATYAYDVFVHDRMRGLWDYNALLKDLLSFASAPPFYFLEYYFAFTLLAPVVFVLIKTVNDKFRRTLRLLFYVLIVAAAFVIGYFNITRMHFFGGSFFAIYVLGMIWGLYDCPFGKKAIALPVGGACLIFGWFSTWELYRNVNQGTGKLPFVDRLTPALGLNPTNFSIIIYALSIVFVFGILFDLMNKIKFKPVALFGKLISLIGKYSLDIFLWHVLIMIRVNSINIPLWPKRIVSYSAMIFLPILGRLAYNKLKSLVKGFYDRDAETPVR